MRLPVTPLFALLLCCPALAAAAQPPYHVIAVDTHVVGSLVRTVETVQAGPNPIDRFEVYHVRRAGCDHDGGEDRAILLAPPLGTGFQFYETSDGPRYADSFVGFYASHDFDVWGYSQRVQGLAAGTCEGGQADCSVMAGWGLAQLAADAEYVRQRIAGGHHGRRPAIGGMSLGGMIGLASIDAHPDAYAAAIVLDAALYSADPVVTAIAADGCATLSGAVAAGVTYSSEQIQALKLFSALAASAPAAPSPLFPPGFTNRQAWVSVLGTPNPGPTSPSPTFIFATGDAASGHLTYADADYLHRGFAGFVDYLTLAEVRDVDCSLAGDRTFTANLGAFDRPVFMISDGRGFGGMVGDTAALLEQADVTSLEYPDLGHVDVFFAHDHRERLERPLLHWLETEAFQR
jgi:pimeloyl-ACP methyl ester carboxylesterase